MDKILAFMESLIEEGLALESLANRLPEDKESGSFIRRYRRWSKNVIEILTYTSMDSHLGEAKEIVKRSLGRDEDRTPELAGVLESAYDLAKGGFVGKIKHLLHADMFSSLSEQAKVLNEAGHLIPAAVLGRIIIEDWLKDQAEKAGLDILASAKASVVNDSLKKAQVFSVPKWRQIQMLLDIGNAAAHGKASDVSPEDISKLLEFIEVNCT